jgi:hypothetical protein
LGVLMEPLCGTSISVVSCSAVIRSSEAGCEARRGSVRRRKNRFASNLKIGGVTPGTDPRRMARW